MAFIKLIARGFFRNLASNIYGNTRTISHLAYHHESSEDMVQRYECYFQRDDIDGWDVRQAMNDLVAYDSVPDPRIIISALNACRRLNDYALTVRFLESVKDKCGNKVKQIWPYIVQEIYPTIQQLGCDLPEDLGFDKPEMYLPSVYDM
ncbi:unnamed protein product [Brassicogethes aeneus]|uniref:Cytochrome c oxidase subunit 5A, mitochondrial n=1 Tax=Brassicogethes aeneus TaxID=1431903 RepID=A0A9P0AYU6_BRAAE|nr:unnamed protein product [Brassicogethes aeneus]